MVETDTPNSGPSPKAARLIGTYDLVGIGDELERQWKDFVSRQAVHTYLTSVRGVTYTPDDSDRVETEATNIRRLTRRMTTMANGKHAQLRDTDHTTLGEFEGLLDMRVLCEDCGAQYQVVTYLSGKRVSVRTIPSETKL